MTKKILIDVVSQAPGVMTSEKAELFESIKDLDLDLEIYETVREFDYAKYFPAKLANENRERFLINHENDFVIHLPENAKIQRDFKVVCEAVLNEEIDLVLQAGKRDYFIDDEAFETQEQFLRAVLEVYCAEGKNTMFKHPVEYIQNIMMCSAPYVAQYVPYANEAGVFNPFVGYSRKFAEKFMYDETIRPSDILNNHNALMLAHYEKLKIKYIRSNAIWEEHISMQNLINSGQWELYTDIWKDQMKKAIPKFSKNITRRKIEFISN